MKWTLKHIEELKRSGKILGYTDNKPKEKTLLPPGRIVTKHFKKRSKEKDYIAWNLWHWCNEHGYQLLEEYKFHPTRRWRADWTIPDLNILLEYEGIFSERSRHTNKMGFVGDALKYREAAKLGWTVLRYTAIDYKNLIPDLNNIFNNKTNAQNESDQK